MSQLEAQKNELVRVNKELSRLKRLEKQQSRNLPSRAPSVGVQSHAERMRAQSGDSSQYRIGLAKSRTVASAKGTPSRLVFK